MLFHKEEILILDVEDTIKNLRGNFSKMLRVIPAFALMGNKRLTEILSLITVASSKENFIHPEAFIHTHGLVDHGAKIGARTKVWAFAHVTSGAIVGEDCNICDHTFVEEGVIIGNRVTLKCGVYLWKGIEISNDVFIGPSAVFTNDLKPRSKKHLVDYPKTHLKQGCSIGANSVILAGVTVGEWALIGAGSTVTKDIPDYAVVWGNPAKFRYWICQCTKRILFNRNNFFTCECGRVYQDLGNKVSLCY